MKKSTSPINEKKGYRLAFDMIPDMGIPVEIVEGLYWLRFKLPFELDHVNLWLMQDMDDGWTLIDTGFQNEATHQLWEPVLRKFKINKIVITHFHPDHFGLAGWLYKKTSAPVFMTAGEQKTVDELTRGDDLIKNLSTLYTPYYKDAGVGDHLLDTMMNKRLLYKDVISTPPKNITDLQDHVILGKDTWEIIRGGGHSDEHACFYHSEKKIFIAGDIVLPDITPNISFFPGKGDNHDPIQDYLDTLSRIKSIIPDDPEILVLPSHGRPFYGLHGRIEKIIGHHDDRFQRIRDICAERPLSALEIMQALFSHRDELSPHNLFFALGETIAHLVHDVRKGSINTIKNNGITLYSTKP